eukprot:3155062-Prymnesium_polylepis.2
MAAAQRQPDTHIHHEQKSTTQRTHMPYWAPPNRQHTALASGTFVTPSVRQRLVPSKDRPGVAP